VPALASFVGGPGPIDPAVVGTNILLTILVVFLFGLTAEIFNSTMDANREEVHGWWTRLLGGPLAFVGAMTFSGGIWSYFRFRPSPAEEDAENEAATETAPEA